MDKDWWLGRTPEQQERKAKGRAKLDESKRRRKEKLDAAEAVRSERREAVTAERAAQQTPEAIEARIQGLTEKHARWRNRAELFELGGLLVAGGLFVLAFVVLVVLFIVL